MFEDFVVFGRNFYWFNAYHVKTKLAIAVTMVQRYHIRLARRLKQQNIEVGQDGWIIV